jgi:molybdopterin/thiamine biosynthesis adenylyltransferase/rhodanese-related sulfurtransferase
VLDKFTKAELSRYHRHLILPDFGLEGQLKIKEAKVLVIGAGGLGAPLLQYLAAAGVGTIGIIDFDHIENSNLQRQVLFTEADLGGSKVKMAIAKLQQMNSLVNFIPYDERISRENALEIIEQYDLVADGSDNFPTRYLVNDACVLLDKPYIYGSIYRFEGQVSVFNQKDGETGSYGPNYRDLFPKPPAPNAVPSCAQGGVLGAMAGIIGSMQANEVLKLITGVGTSLSGRLFILDSLNFETQTIKLAKGTSRQEIKELIDYEAFCNMAEDYSPFDVNEVSVQELDKMLKEGKDIQLIDVRTEFEHHIANLGGKIIPLEEIVNHVDEIDREKPVVMYCKVGIRSTEAILHLQNIYKFNNLYNLKGGINAWAAEIDNKFVQ